MKNIKPTLLRISSVIALVTISTFAGWGQTNDGGKNPKANPVLNTLTPNYYSIATNYTIDATSLTEFGVVCATHSDPTISDTKIPQGGTYVSGTYSKTIEGLDHGTRYYVRAYQTIRGSTTYSSEIYASTNTYATEPSQSTPNFAVMQLTTTSIKLSWVNENDAKFQVLQKALGTTAPSPLDDAPLGSYGIWYTQNGGTINYSTTNTNFQSLIENTTYTFIIQPGAPTSPLFATNTNIRQTNPSTLTATTLKAAPSTQASEVNFTDQTSNSVTINWTAGNGDGRSVFINATNSFTAPDNLNLPTANTTWQNSGQQCVYNGTGTSIAVTGLSEFQNYYVRVYDYSLNSANNPNYITTEETNNPNYITAPSAQWNGGTSDWSVATNWYSGAVPTSSQAIVIPESTTPPTISSTESGASVTIEQGGALTIATNGSLSVSGNLVIEGDANGSGSLLVEGSGSLSVSGSSIFNRYIPSGGYHYVSNPTNGTDIMQFYGFYADGWNESSASWVALDGNSTINSLQGYSIKYNSQSQTIDFTGTFNNGSQSTSVTNSNTGNESYGWNLVGNPYPSAIDWDAASGWTRNNINATAYFYNGSGYVDYNYSTGSGTAASSIIPAGQGFFILVEGTSSTTLAMTNDVRVNSPSTDFYKSKNQAPQMAVKISNEFEQDQTTIAFYPNATDEYDRIIDGYKLFGWSTNLPQIYTITPDNKKLSINTIDDLLLSEKKVHHTTQLGYISRINTVLNIALSKNIQIPDSINILLVDNQTGDTTDLKEESYSFETAIGDFDNRFSIVLKKSPENLTGITSNDGTVFAYVAEHNLHVIFNKPVSSGQIVAYDLLGRELINKSLTTKTHYILPISQKSNIFVLNIYTDKTILLRQTLVNKR